MKEALVPFLTYVIFQPFIMSIGLIVFRKRKMGITECMKAWVLGQMVLFAVLQILAVPMILLRIKFGVLFWSFLIISTILFCFGFSKSWTIRFRKPNRKRFNHFVNILLIITFALILWQSLIYFFRMHLDEDDARWLAEANDALQYGHMMIRDFDTGDYLGYFKMMKDTTSPWPMMLSIVSRCLDVRTAVFAHSIYAPVEVMLMYAIYWLIASELFKRMEAKVAFLFCVAVLNLFFAFDGYTQSEFALTRIWQGKATVAGVIIPLLVYLFLAINRNGKTYDWLSLGITCCAACLMSGMGISLCGIITSIYGGYHIVAYQDWRRIPALLLAILPSVFFVLIYSVFKSLV